MKSINRIIDIIIGVFIGGYCIDGDEPRGEA